MGLSIVAVFRLVNGRLGKLLDERGKLRGRGPKPLGDDREVLTAEIVGEFPGLLLSRFWRKLRGLTGCVVLCQREGLSPLRFSELFVR